MTSVLVGFRRRVLRPEAFLDRREQMTPEERSALPEGSHGRAGTLLTSVVRFISARRGLHDAGLRRAVVYRPLLRVGRLSLARRVGYWDFHVDDDSGWATLHRTVGGQNVVADLTLLPSQGVGAVVEAHGHTLQVSDSKWRLGTASLGIVRPVVLPATR